MFQLQFGVGVPQKEAICQSAKAQTALWQRGFQLNALQNAPALDLHHRHYLARDFANPNTLITASAACRPLRSFSHWLPRPGFNFAECTSRCHGARIEEMGQLRLI